MGWTDTLNQLNLLNECFNPKSGFRLDQVLKHYKLWIEKIVQHDNTVN